MIELSPKVCCLLLIGSLAFWARAGAADERLPAQSDERFMRTYYFPAHDSNGGRLYRGAIELLNARRRFSQEFRLTPALVHAAHGQTGPPSPPAQKDAGEKDAQPEHAAETRWVKALDHPLIPDEELAYVNFRAERYEEAARIYESLREQRPDDTHLLLMLALATKSLGDSQKAKELLRAVAPEKAEAREWAQWMIEMMQLSSVERREEK